MENRDGQDHEKHPRNRSNHRGDTRSVPERTLVIIGGHEDKRGEKVILKELVRQVGNGKLVVTTVASQEPEGYFETYERIFCGLGVGQVALLEIQNRGQAMSDEAVRVLEGADCLFFTGGDQLRITSQIGDTPVFQLLRKLYEEGAVMAGTSAGASVMCETMLVSGAGDESHRLGDTLNMAPGLGLIPGVIIDQHFAERGRMGRLLSAVAQNPRMLGIGIDENTAIVVRNETQFRVIGSGSVYIVDGSQVSASNIAEGQDDATLSLYDVRLHVLTSGDSFDLKTRRPRGVEQEAPPTVAEPVAAGE
ncbi:MAG: cyanophycinase [Chthonomonadales bacterium]|nr:cyanophycinase [Chthonomonadales bacterium]